ATGKKVRIKSAQRLRGEAEGADAKPPAQKATQTPTAAPSAKKGAKAKDEAKGKKAATRAKQGAQKAKKPGGLDAAARVLAESKKPMTCRQSDSSRRKQTWSLNRDRALHGRCSFPFCEFAGHNREHTPAIGPR
ncbi:MAG: hypothetical protein ACYTG0_42755, partial [Planctomycetota bacterium]